LPSEVSVGRARPPDTRARILEEARAILTAHGADALSMSEVAARAAVSKALIHYHFADKRALLLDVMSEAAGRAGRRVAEAAPSGNDDALERAWKWLDHEARAGDVRVLHELSRNEDARVGEAARASVLEWEAAARGLARAVLDALGVHPRIPSGMCEQLFATYAHGVIARAGAHNGSAERAGFDTLWLALLTLAE
jgi:AcrR family transcriptional regulator